jgi:hypothetical protein
MIGDGAKHRMHDIFVALAPPVNQIQARPALATESVTYVAGQAGGRAPQGRWQPDRMRDIRAVALDATGRLWVAEGDAAPRRLSVWTTDGAQGRLAREFFAPTDGGSPVAVDPLDPGLIYAGGCEWRIDPATGRAGCLGVVTRYPFPGARFVTEKGRVFLALTPAAGAELVFERVGDGDYRPCTGSAAAAMPSKFQLVPTPGGPSRLVTADGYDLGTLFDPTGATSRAAPAQILDGVSPLPPAAAGPALTQTQDGRVFITASRGRVWEFEITGLDTLRPLAAGKVTLPVR